MSEGLTRAIVMFWALGEDARAVRIKGSAEGDEGDVRELDDDDEGGSR